MSKARKQRMAANTAEAASMSTNEKILKECHDFYVDEEKGLILLGEDVGLSLLPPRKKIIILLIGNHSAGKSSFINWYIEEHVQKTAVAIETQGFSLVTSGKRRESLTGNATLHLFPQLRELNKLEGVVDYLSTEVATSKQKKFAFVTFIDTPGLVDGDMKYPFDVDRALVWLGDMADRIIVFFDPLGQALCRRTLDIVETLNESRPDRIKFYLSKADTVFSQNDRQRVLMQITQELCKRKGLNRAGFDMPTIFIPTLTGKNPQCENSIEELCKEIEITINSNIQNTLNTLEKDAGEISSRIQQKLDEDKEKSGQNRSVRCRSWFLYLLAHTLVILYVTLASGIVKIPKLKPLPFDPIVFSVIVGVYVIVLLSGYKTTSYKPTMSKRERNIMIDRREHIEKYVKDRKAKLYEDYLRQCVGGLDMA